MEFVELSTDNLPFLKNQVLSWALDFTHCYFLNSNDSKGPGSQYINGDYDLLVGVGKVAGLNANTTDSFQELRDFHDREKKMDVWIPFL